MDSVEPLSHQADAQHALDADRRTAPLARGVVQQDQLAQRRPWHDSVHLGEELSSPGRLVNRSNPTQSLLDALGAFQTYGEA